MSSSSEVNMNHLAPQHVSGSSTGVNTANTSPTDSASGNSLRANYNPNGVMNSAGGSVSNVRMGAGSPSYDASGSSRLFTKRAREIQAEEGVGPPGIWGPVSSSNQSSSSLRDRESMAQELNPVSSFQEPPPVQNDYASPVHRRARAGTVPSRFSPGGFTTTPTVIPGIPSTSRPSPAPSPFKSNSPQNVDMVDNGPVPVAQTSSPSSVASRLRSGSLNLPPRANYVNVNPFGPSIFASSWTPNRPSGSSGLPSSPAHSSFSKDDEGTHMAPKTLDYLGLVDSPQAARATLAKPMGLDTLIEGQRVAALQPFIPELGGIQRSNRIRSYSVNAKEKYAEDEEEEEEEQRNLYSAQQSGSVTPSTSQANALAQASIHSLGVGAFSPSRPRARTAGVLDSPAIARLKSYLATPSRLDSMTSAADIGRDYFDLGNGSDNTLKLGNMHPRPSSGEGGLASIEESSLEGPTRSLWLGNIPASTTTTSLIHIFQGFGSVESARVLTHKNCGFVNFNSLASAVQARDSLNGKEIFPGAGPVRIGFAKPSSAGSNGTPTPNGGAYGSPSPGPQGDSAPPVSGDGTSPRDGQNGSAGVNGKDSRLDGTSALKLPDLAEMREDIVRIVQEFGSESADAQMVGKNIDKAVEYQTFEPEIPPIPEPTHNRVHDAPKLRDIRKRIDNGNCSQAEIEEIAMGMLSEIAELSSDYLGNTVVQKLFEYCSEEIKEAMLVEIGPHLSEIGIHKNGTWAGQKIIDVARTPAQMEKICDCLRPYTVALFLDQYGNYVLQCCLRFGAPWNDFIFETMLSRMWEIAQGRFGARAMRACLESHHASKDQQRMLAAAIALHSVQLATNANGALLLTWFLDTCTFPRRRTVLAPRLVPHLVHLCTHKVAYLTVLKVINQRNEPEARDTILKALFFSPGDQVLEEILSDHSCGATLIFKVLTTPFFEETMRSEVVQNVRNVLLKLKASPSQGYKRLMDEVGLSTRNGASNNANTTNGPKDHPRDGANGNSNANVDRRGAPHHNHHNANRDVPPVSFYTVPPSFDSATIAAAATAAAQQMPQNGMFDPTMRAFEQLNLGPGNLYGSPGPPGLGNPALQYQALLQQSMARPGAGFFGMPPPMPNYNNSAASQDQYRTGHPGGSPVPQPQQMVNNPMLAGMGAGPGMFNPLVAQQLMAGYSYPMVYQQPPQPQGNGAGSGRRGGRR